MRLLIDLQGMQNQSRHRGIGRYVTNLSRALLRNGHGHDLRFLLSSRYREGIDDVVATFSGLASPDQFLVFDVPGPTSALAIENGWRAGAAHIIYDAFVRQLEPDALLIGSLFEGGSDDTIVSVGPADRGYVTAAILYDLIPLLNPDEHIGSDGARQWYFSKVDQARRADLLLGISHSACREGIDHLPADERQVRFVGAAAGEEFANTDYRAFRDHPVADEIKAYHGITRPFIMHTSALDARKNFEGLIAAFGLLPEALRRRHQLVLVCKLHPAGESSLRRAIERAGLGPDEVVLTGFVEDDELRVLYANADLFVFPSFHEGFGLPVLEAMWCGAPAVGSGVSSVPEVIGHPEALFDPGNVEEMARVITRALSDAHFRSELLDHAKAHCRTFGWDTVARRAIAAIEQAAGQRLPQPSPTAPRDDCVRIAELGCWAQPSDADLLLAAQALAANDQLSRSTAKRDEWLASRAIVA